MKIFVKYLPIIIFLQIFGVSFAEAQQNVSAASLSGVIKDTNQSIISGANVSAVNLETNQTQSVVSDAEGRFRFTYLPVGNYEIKAAQNGFEDASRRITATVGQVLQLKLVLKVKTISAQIDVTSDEPIIETSRTQIAATILPENIEQLPLNGRNFMDLALLLPAVSRTNTGNIQRFAETSAVPGTGISVAGQRNLANSFIVDGTSANDDSVELAGNLLFARK
jgi:hypothetical protein